MPASRAAWPILLARVDGALPFLPDALAEMLAFAALRALWRIHVRDYPFEEAGLSHDPGPDAEELTRSWHDAERRAFLSWIVRRGPAPLARAARVVLAAKGATEQFTTLYAPADRALERLDALLPTHDPLATLHEWVRQLREEEPWFMEGDSEMVTLGAHVFSRSAPRGAAWAASLAVAMRPQLFALGAAPLALAGIAPRGLFRPSPEFGLCAQLEASLNHAAGNMAEALDRLHAALRLGEARLGGLYASSQAPAAWRLISALGPLSRAELARALAVTARTASQAALALERAGLATMRAHDHVIAALAPGPSSPIRKRNIWPG